MINPELNGSSFGHESIEDLYAEKYSDLVRYANSIVHSGAMAEDAVHDAFESLIIKFNKFEDRGIPLFNLMCRIVHNKAIDHLRRSNRFAPIDSLAVQSDKRTDHLNFDPEECILSKDRLAVALGAISTQEQLDALLAQADGYTNPEIALSQGKSVSSINSLVHRARQSAMTADKEYLAA